MKSESPNQTKYAQLISVRLKHDSSGLEPETSVLFSEKKEDQTVGIQPCGPCKCPNDLGEFCILTYCRIEAFENVNW